MKLNRGFNGVLLVMLFVAVPVAIWATMMPLGERFADYADSTRSFGQITALAGTALFALSFVLTTRMKWVEKLFGGLDKVYTIHHIMGAVSFILLLAHPVLLVLNLLPDDAMTAALFFVPDAYWPINFGIIALAAMILLLVLTFFVKMKYLNWKISHKFMGFAFIVACIHFFMVDTDITRSAALKGVMIGFSAIGILSFAYGSFLRHLMKKKYVYEISSVNVTGPVTTISLKAKGDKINFKAGQFVFIKFINSDISDEPHPFTISSAPDKEELRFMIKSLGDFTQEIQSAKPGTIVEVDGPYGQFMYEKSENSPQIWVAGGIGVTPFLSFVQDILKKGRVSAPIDMYYCVKTQAEAVALKELDEVVKKIKGFRYFLFCTDKQGYLNTEFIKKNSGELKDKKIYLCGPPAMKESLEGQLLKEGVPSNSIIQEDFSFR